MTKFTSKTLSNLNKFATAIANELINGVKNGQIQRVNEHGESHKEELKKFITMYKDVLQRKFGFNGFKVANVCKTPKQLKFVVGLIDYKMKEVA